MTETGAARPVAYAWAILAVAITTATAVALRSVGFPDPEMLYFLAILIAAAWLGRGPSIVAAAASVAAYDFFFVRPLHTFAVAEQRILLTFLLMFGVGLVISTLTTRIRRQQQAASAREERTAALYALSRDLGTAVDVGQITEIGARHVSGALRARAEVLAGGDAAPPGAVCVPLRVGPETLGVLALYSEPPSALGPDQLGFAEAVSHQLALAFERVRLVEGSKAAALRARTEELRSALLSAVSHDLRTPLATIGGSLSALRDDPDLPAGTRDELLDDAVEETERLERLVSNLLEMTRLQSGEARVKREWLVLEEIIGSARNRLETDLAARKVHASLPADLPLISGDPVLLGQVLVNLLENTVKYTPAGTPIDIAAAALPGAVELTVADRGPGFAAGDEQRVFERFFRAGGTGASGAGLGLAICRGIVEAHGGTITAENRPGGGALFRIVLPLVGTPPAPPPLEEEEEAGEVAGHG